ncbi:MAG: hypothetical protein JJE52_09005 [Acidimicrobiia bacterium]|nr:hypothetical protein [Acidimicrobiia bacterium]
MEIRHVGVHERGAALVEYALVIALVAVALVAGAQAVTDGGRDGLTERGDTAAAQGEVIGDLTGGGTPSPLPPSPPPSPSGDLPSIDVAPLESEKSSGNGNKWNLTVTVPVVAPDGTAVSGAQVTGKWDPGDQVTCEATVAGDCTFTIEAKNTPTMSFTVVSVNYLNSDGTTAAFTPAGPVGITETEP